MLRTALVAAAVVACSGSREVRAHGDLHEVIDALSVQIAANSGDAELVLRRGELYRIHQDWQSAAADYDRAEALAPPLAAVDLARGEMFAQSGRLAEARAALDRYLERKPGASVGFAARARVLARQGEWRDAAADFARAIETGSEPDPALFLERAQALRADGQRDAAIGALQAGIARLGSLVIFVLPAIEVEVEAGRIDAALGYVDTMLATAQRKERWLFKRGEILLQADRRAEAAAAFREATAALERVPIERRSVAAMVDFGKQLRDATAQTEQRR